MENKELIQLLVSLGFDLEESQIYAHMLNLGPESVLRITYEADMQRTLVYRIIKRLMAKGLVETINVGKKKSYVVKSPSFLYQYIHRKKEQAFTQEANFNTLYPKLLQLYKKSKTHPVSYFEGFEGCNQAISIVMAEHQENPKNELKILSGNEESIVLVYIEMNSNKYFNIRKHNKIKAKVIIPFKGRATSPKYYEISKDLDEVKVIPEMDSDTMTIISDSSLLHINLKDNRFQGILISDENIIQEYAKLFDYMWSKK